jgi:hypothetical protein
MRVRNLWNCRAYAVGHGTVLKSPSSNHTRSFWYGVYSAVGSVAVKSRQRAGRLGASARCITCEEDKYGIDSAAAPARL